MRNRILAVGTLSLVLGAELGAQAAPKPAAAPPAAQRRANLLDPARAFWRTRAPDTVRAEVETSRGPFTLEIVRAWAPAGVDRFYNLARAGYFDDSRFFRVISGFVAQFGIAGDPAIANLWGSRRLPADSVRTSNVRGTITYAQFKPTDRTTNLFVNLRDNVALDTLGFAPIGRVIQGMEVVDSLYSGYGEVIAAAAPIGNPKRLYGESNKYLDKEYPNLDRILRITILPR
jgi:cyclophilin family peptidyl-prolyl cis-trans isomerase